MYWEEKCPSPRLGWVSEVYRGGRGRRPVRAEEGPENATGEVYCAVQGLVQHSALIPGLRPRDRGGSSKSFTKIQRWGTQEGCGLGWDVET